MEELNLKYVGRYGNIDNHIAYCPELDYLVQLEEINEIDSPDAILLNGFVLKIKETQVPVFFGTK